MTWQLDFNRYINAPHEAWPPGKPLQARKLEECRARRCSATGADLALMIDRACEAARRRLDANAPTLFLINCGSSGSHWVEAMLSALPGIHACGEVYVPPRIGGELAEAPASDRRCFLDALHQVHMDVPVEIAERDVLINSAHSWNPHDLMGEAAIPVVLVRDPVDVVASRTFRKPKLRRHLDPTVSDEEYLEQNINMVEKFYRSALRRNPKHLIRYEDMREHRVDSLATLAGLLGHTTSRASLVQIADRYSAEGQQGSGQRLSNIFRGPELRLPPRLLDRTIDRLSDIRAKLGYQTRIPGPGKHP